MATNDTKVHSMDAQFPPISEATLNATATRLCSPYVYASKKEYARKINAQGNYAAHFPTIRGSRPDRVQKLFAAAFNLQVILHRKNIRHTVSSNIRHVLVSVIVNIAFERDVSILHDDMDRSYEAYP